MQKISGSFLQETKKAKKPFLNNSILRLDPIKTREIHHNFFVNHDNQQGWTKFACMQKNLPHHPQNFLFRTNNLERMASGLQQHHNAQAHQALMLTIEFGLMTEHLAVSPPRESKAWPIGRWCKICTRSCMIHFKYGLQGRAKKSG